MSEYLEILTLTLIDFTILVDILMLLSYANLCYYKNIGMQEKIKRKSFHDFIYEIYETIATRDIWELQNLLLYFYQLIDFFFTAQCGKTQTIVMLQGNASFYCGLKYFYKKKILGKASQQCSHQIYQTFIGPLAVAGRVLWIRVRPSVFPPFRPDVFWGLVHQFFLKLSMVLGTHVLLCVTGPDFF